MRFADPHACPDCRGALAGESTCPRCGLDLTSLEVRQLWQVLLQADQLLARATAARPPANDPGPSATAAAEPATAPAAPGPTPAAHEAEAPPAPEPHVAPVSPPPPTFTPGAPEWRPYPAPAGPGQSASPPRDRSWSVGTVLLVLGAFGLIVAGLIFVTRSWDTIGLTGKALILLAVTSAIGVLGVWVTRRTLQASAEAVWTVFLALLTLDFFAARHENLLGLGSIEIDWAWIVWGATSVALAVGIGLWARRLLEVELVSTSVAAGVAVTVAGVGAAAVSQEWDFAWQAFLALVVAGLLALSTRPARLALTTLVVRLVVAGFFVFAYGAAVVELFVHAELDELVRGGHGLPMLLMGVASVVIGWVVPQARVPAAALGVLAACALVMAPLAEAGGLESTWVVVSVGGAVLAIVGARGKNDWMRGVRLGSLPAVGGVVLIQLTLFVDAFNTAGRVVDDPWRQSWTSRLDELSVDDRAAWLVPVVLVALMIVAWFVPHWPDVADLRPHAPVFVASCVAIGAIDGVVALRLPVWGVAAGLLVLACAATGLRIRGLTAVPSPLPAALVVAASVLAVASHGVSAWTWVLGGVVLVVLAARGSGSELRHVHAAVGAGLVFAGTAALVALLDLDDSFTPLAVVVVALMVLAVAQTVGQKAPIAPSLEVASATALVVALVVPASSGEIAVRWTVAGVALIALGFTVAARRWQLWPGAGCLLVAYIALLVGSGFSFVEAYTLPLAAAALATGLYLVTRRPEASTWTYLGPGLAIGLLPSLPQALVDPTDLRALLLGLGGLVVLAVGVRLGWQAPFVAGASILALLVLFNIGPYANAAPRVVVIAAVSAVLLGVGITWEDRVRDGRKLVGYVRSMR